MAWKPKVGKDFKSDYGRDSDLKPLFDFAIEIVLNADNPQKTIDPRKLPLVLNCPGHPESCMMNLQNTHALFFKVLEKTHQIEFVSCR